MPDFVKLTLGEGDNVREYALLPMPPVKAVYFIPKVVKALSSVLLSDADIKSLSDGKASMNEAAKLILGGLANIEPEALTELAMEAIQYEVYAGPTKLSDPAHFDDWFRKHPQDMLQVMAWAIWENCKDFFPGGSELFQEAKEKVAGKQSRSRKSGSRNTRSDES
jgi:hypothetical protein